MAPGRQRPQRAQAAAAATPGPGHERLAAPRRTPAGKAWDARRQVSGEPGLGQSQAARGCRRCLRRGWATSRGAWRLVGRTPHLLKMGRYGRVRRAIEAVRETRLWA